MSLTGDMQKNTDRIAASVDEAVIRLAKVRELAVAIDVAGRAKLLDAFIGIRAELAAIRSCAAAMNAELAAGRTLGIVPLVQSAEEHEKMKQSLKRAGDDTFK